MGTIYPARFFKQEDTWGSLEEGKDADILLLKANPLEDAANIKTLRGVMLRGSWFPKEAIDRNLEEIAKNAANKPL
jgi:imidazolonepropionase-like amidohydrolase